MKLLKQLAVVAALSSIASYASALTPIADKDLSAVSGRDGVSIAADLHVHIGDFTYTNTNKTNGGSVSFNNIDLTGTFAMTLDVISGKSFLDLAAAKTGAFNGEAFTTLGLDMTNPNNGDLTAFYGGGDVVKIAIPKLYTTSGQKLNMTVGSITMANNQGGTAASFGSIAMHDIQLQGTSVYIWAH